MRKVAKDVQADRMNYTCQIPFRYSSCNDPICLAGNERVDVPSLIGGLQPIPVFRKFFSKKIVKYDIIFHIDSGPTVSPHRRSHSAGRSHHHHHRSHVPNNGHSNTMPALSNTKYVFVKPGSLII